MMLFNANSWKRAFGTSSLLCLVFARSVFYCLRLFNVQNTIESETGHKHARRPKLFLHWIGKGGMSPLGWSWLWFFLNEGQIHLERKKTEVSICLMSFIMFCFVLKHTKVIQIVGKSSDFSQYISPKSLWLEAVGIIITVPEKHSHAMQSIMDVYMA